MATKAIHRVTMFKIPEPANIQPIVEQYSKLQKEAKKVRLGGEGVTFRRDKGAGVSHSRCA